MKQHQQSQALNQTPDLSDAAVPQLKTKRSWVSPKIDELDYDETQAGFTGNGGDFGFYS